MVNNPLEDDGAAEVGGLWLVNPVIPPIPPGDEPGTPPNADWAAAKADANWSAVIGLELGIDLRPLANLKFKKVNFILNKFLSKQKY